MLYKELTPQQRQSYMDAALRLKTESASRRASVKAAKVQQYRPPSAYLLYCWEKFAEVKAVDTSAKLGDVMKAVAKQWRGLSETEKQLFQKRVDATKPSGGQGMRSKTSSSAAA